MSNLFNFIAWNTAPVVVYGAFWSCLGTIQKFKSCLTSRFLWYTEEKDHTGFNGMWVNYLFNLSVNIVVNMIFSWKLSWGWKSNPSFTCLAHIFNLLAATSSTRIFSSQICTFFQSNTPSMTKTVITFYRLGFLTWLICIVWKQLNLARRLRTKPVTAMIQSNKENRVNSWPHYNREVPIDV